MSEKIIKGPFFEKKLKRIQQEGFKKLQVICDFDRTLTKAYSKGKKTVTSYAHVREGDYLSKKYSKKAFALYDKYYPYEINPKLNIKIKIKKMNEWWKKHFELMVKCGMNNQIVKDIVKEGKLNIRGKVPSFLKKLNKHRVPVLIFSAGIGDIIKEHLKKEKLLFKNIHIISNNYKYNKKGFVVGMENGKLVHTFNKNEFLIDKKEYSSKMKERKNVILVGDSLGDLEMVKGMKHEVVLNIGFLNENLNENLKIYKEKFDLIILGDGNGNILNKILEKIK